jgi:hypothetical protein
MEGVEDSTPVSKVCVSARSKAAAPDGNATEIRRVCVFSDRCEVPFDSFSSAMCSFFLTLLLFFSLVFKRSGVR